MSAQHTQERLEVEDATNEDGRAYLTIKGKMMALGVVFNLQLRGNTLNDASRLAACWNACEGVSTEHLEDDAVRKLIQDRDLLLAQRDKLVDAAKNALNALQICGMKFEHIEAELRAAIDKAIG